MVVLLSLVNINILYKYMVAFIKYFLNLINLSAPFSVSKPVLKHMFDQSIDISVLKDLIL